MSDTYTIEHRGDHYEIWQNGKFAASADTKAEAARIVDEMEEEAKGGG